VHPRASMLLTLSVLSPVLIPTWARKRTFFHFNRCFSLLLPFTLFRHFFVLVVFWQSAFIFFTAGSRSGSRDSKSPSKLSQSGRKWCVRVSLCDFSETVFAGMFCILTLAFLHTHRCWLSISDKTTVPSPPAVPPTLSCTALLSRLQVFIDRSHADGGEYSVSQDGRLFWRNVALDRRTS